MSKPRKTWSRKGNCPECEVSTGSKHRLDCKYAYTLPPRVVYYHPTADELDKIMAAIEDGKTQGLLFRGAKRISWLLNIQIN